MGIVIGAVAVVFVLALIIFPGVRGKLKVLYLVEGLATK